MGTDTQWRPTRRSDGFDLALMAAFGLGAAVSLYMGGEVGIWGDLADYSRPLGIALVVLGVAPLAARRRLPLTALLVATVAVGLMVLYEIPEASVLWLAYFILLYSAGAYGRGKRRDVARGAVAVIVLILAAYEIFGLGEEVGESLTYVPPELVIAFAAALNIFYLAAAWMLGDLVRNRREREAVLEAQADALRRAQAASARRAVLEERVRIARELHDVVAHHVSVMGVQAGAARRMLDRRPEAVPELLSTVEGTSRQAVDELQRMLGVLRRDDGEDVDATNETLAGLATLADQVRAAGLALTTDLQGRDGGPTLDLPPAVDHAAYRIVQEALTNVLKHAGPAATARVSLICGSEELDLQIVDDGAGADQRAPLPLSTGHGVAGMRERVVWLGGDLQAGPRPQGGFEVRARFPLNGTAGQP